MDFDSHAVGVVANAVAAINVLSPGWQRGREYRPPAGEEVAGALREVLHFSGAHADQPVPAAELAQFAEYAGKLRSVFELLDDRKMDTACETVNALLRETGAIPVLSRHDGEAWHLHFHPLDATWARSWAGPMATGLAMMLGSPMADRLGVCSASACDRVYVDTSRNGTRRFCSTACQNRVKAAAYRERSRA